MNTLPQLRHTLAVFPLRRCRLAVLNMPVRYTRRGSIRRLYRELIKRSNLDTILTVWRWNSRQIRYFSVRCGTPYAAHLRACPAATCNSYFPLEVGGEELFTDALQETKCILSFHENKLDELRKRKHGRNSVFDVIVICVKEFETETIESIIIRI